MTNLLSRRIAYLHTYWQFVVYTFKAENSYISSVIHCRLGIMEGVGNSQLFLV